MKRSLAHGAGYLEIDHRDSPGVTPADLAHVPNAIVVGKGQRFETDTLSCSHCQRTIVLNPQRTRARGFCPKCNHYVCDLCEGVRAQTGECAPMAKTFDRLHDLAARNTDPVASAIILTDQE